MSRTSREASTCWVSLNLQFLSWGSYMSAENLFWIYHLVLLSAQLALTTASSFSPCSSNLIQSSALLMTFISLASKFGSMHALQIKVLQWFYSFRREQKCCFGVRFFFFSSLLLRSSYYLKIFDNCTFCLLVKVLTSCIRGCGFNSSKSWLCLSASADSGC